MEDFSLSNSLSQVSVYESESFGKAYLDDAAHQIAGGSPPAISNEEISAGDAAKRDSTQFHRSASGAFRFILLTAAVAAVILAFAADIDGIVKGLIR